MTIIDHADVGLSTWVVAIDPDGTVLELGGQDFLGLARAEFNDQVDVFSCRPITDGPPTFPNFDRVLVGACDEWGRTRDGATCNPKAWALYGRSPLAGRILFAHDSDDAGGRLALPVDFIRLLRTDFVKPGVMNVAHMRSLAASAGLVWPEGIAA